MRKLTEQSENANAIVELMRKYNFYATDVDIEGESNIFELMGFTCTYANISFIFQNEGGGITDTVVIYNSTYDCSSKSELIDVFLGTLREESLIPTPRIEEAPIKNFLTPQQKESINTEEDATPSEDGVVDLFAELRKLWD
jgi:hypothetical protein